jgi:phage gp36-like protein
MPYVDDPAFQATLTGDLLSRSSLEQRAAALERAESEVEGYLRAGGYATPLDQVSVDDDLRGAITDIARYRLAVTLRLLPEPAAQSALYLDYKAAIAWLERVANGQIPIDVIDADGDAGAESGAPSFYTTTRRKWNEL